MVYLVEGFENLIFRSTTTGQPAESPNQGTRKTSYLVVTINIFNLVELV